MEWLSAEAELASKEAWLPYRGAGLARGVEEEGPSRGAVSSKRSVLFEEGVGPGGVVSFSVRAASVQPRPRSQLQPRVNHGLGKNEMMSVR